MAGWGLREAKTSQSARNSPFRVKADSVEQKRSDCDVLKRTSARFYPHLRVCVSEGGGGGGGRGGITLIGGGKGGKRERESGRHPVSVI